MDLYALSHQQLISLSEKDQQLIRVQNEYIVTLKKTIQRLQHNDDIPYIVGTCPDCGHFHDLESEECEPEFLNKAQWEEYEGRKSK